MLNLNSNLDLDIKSFLRWWRRELSFLVPEKIKRLFNDRHGFLIIRPDGQQLSLSYQLGEQTDFIAKIDRNEVGITYYKTLAASDERLLKATPLIRLSMQDAVSRELTLPAAAKENLTQVIAYELDRYTPFKADQVYFSVQPLTGNTEQDQLNVLLVLTMRDFLDVLYEDVKALGLSPLFVDYQGVPNNLDPVVLSYNLLPEKFQQKTPKTPRLIYASLMTTSVVLLVSVLVMPVWLEYQTVNALTEKVRVIEKDAKKIKSLQAEMDAIINESQKLLDEKNAVPMVVGMLDSLSTIIKDDTWLAYLQYSDNHLQIQGESPAASTLIGILEASDFFTNARFVSPVTQNNVSKLERFQITVDSKKTGRVDDNP
ncbi:MAG: PilN domain-containing protein [Methylococcaceae bacterium]|jgi:general secretion pathway protein L